MEHLCVVISEIIGFPSNLWCGSDYFVQVQPRNWELIIISTCVIRLIACLFSLQMIVRLILDLIHSLELKSFDLPIRKSVNSGPENACSMQQNQQQEESNTFLKIKETNTLYCLWPELYLKKYLKWTRENWIWSTKLSHKISVADFKY